MCLLYTVQKMRRASRKQIHAWSEWGVIYIPPSWNGDVRKGSVPFVSHEVCGFYREQQGKLAYCKLFLYICIITIIG